MDEYDEEYEEATNQVLAVLEEWGSESKFIWLRELHRITDIDKGLLRNILNELKNSKKLSKDKEEYHSMTWLISSNVLYICTSAVGLPVSQEKKDAINKEIMNKEIRILDINVVMTQAAALKKEKD